MKKLIICLVVTCLSINIFAQTGAFSVEAHLGFNGSFFVKDLPERRDQFVYEFNRKNFIGSVRGIEASIGLSDRSRLKFGFARAVNKKKINYSSTNFFIQDFFISHTSDYLNLIYEFTAKTKKINFDFEGGLTYQRTRQQELSVSSTGGGFQERNFKNSGLEDGGTVFGIGVSKMYDKHIRYGVRARAYYIISTGLLEQVTFAPFIEYRF